MTESALQFAQALGHEATDKRIDILRRIGEAGSISEAARGAGVSYKAAWQALENLSNLAGATLIDKSVGGSGGGGARLTEAGAQLLAAADRLSAARMAVMAELEGQSGNAFSMRGLASLSLRTSMRNQLPCVVNNITWSAGAARVTLALQHGELLTAKITLESAELLGLTHDMPALALCKASAVRICNEAQATEGLSVLAGYALPSEGAAKTTPTSQAADMAVQLSAGLHIVGFPAPGHRFEPGQRVVAVVDESAVAIAVLG